MLTLLTRLRIKPFVLGIDWQADHLRAVLLRFTNQANTPTDQELLGQWFKQYKQGTERLELLVFVTPRIVTP